MKRSQSRRFGRYRKGRDDVDFVLLAKEVADPVPCDRTSIIDDEANLQLSESAGEVSDDRCGWHTALERFAVNIAAQSEDARGACAVVTFRTTQVHLTPCFAVPRRR